MTIDENYRRQDFEQRIECSKNYGQLFLPKDEYAMVLSEFNTHMSDEERTHDIVTKPIGEYYYTIINKGFNDYTVIGKDPIISELDKDWEELE